MNLFDDIKLEWGDTEYVIPSDRVMGAIASIEEIITLSELGVAMQKGSAPLAKIAMAYGSVLRYAGCPVSDQEIYFGMFDGKAKENQAKINASISGLLQMMVPKGAFKDAKPGEAKPGEPRPDAANSSEKPTSSPSGIGE